jgi:hypothetical protein
MIHGPTGRSRPGPGLKVDPWGGVRLDSDGRPETFDPEFHWRAGSRSREARRWPTGKVFCEGYDHGEAHPGDPRGLVLVPAVVALADAITAEVSARADSDYRNARWYTVVVRKGYVEHVLTEASAAEIRRRADDRDEQRLPKRTGVFTLCGRWTSQGARGEGEPFCKACIRLWKRPS